MGEPKVSKRLTKVLDLTGKKGDTFMVNAWGRGTCLPETDNDKNRRFGVEVVLWQQMTQLMCITQISARIFWTGSS